MSLASGTTAKCSTERLPKRWRGAEVLLNEMPAVRLLLAELAKERSGQANEIEKIFRLALEHARNYQMASSRETPATPTLSDVTELVNDKT